MLTKVSNKNTETVINALIKEARKLPGELFKSLIWDRGKEMNDHKRFTLASDIKIYFCDPQCPWQCGTNENMNRLLRQYFPKGADLSVYSQVELNKVAQKMNQRFRKIPWDTKHPQINCTQVVQRSIEPAAANIHPHY